jgi:predicted PurR-regulated permease PerM
MDNWLASAPKRYQNVRASPLRAFPVMERVSPQMEYVVIGGAIVALLYFDREIFIPLALAVLLSFALSPVVLAFRHIGLGRVISVLVAACLAFLLIVSTIAVVVHQLAQMGPDLPRFQVTISDKIRALGQVPAHLGSGWKGSGSV